MDITVPDSRFQSSKIHIVHCSTHPPSSPDLGGWFGRAGGMRSGHLVGERAMLSLWLEEGSRATWVTVKGFRLEQ